MNIGGRITYTGKGCNEGNLSLVMSAIDTEANPIETKTIQISKNDKPDFSIRISGQGANYLVVNLSQKLPTATGSKPDEFEACSIQTQISVDS
jgi:hypothetical protein